MYYLSNVVDDLFELLMRDFTTPYESRLKNYNRDFLTTDYPVNSIYFTKNGNTVIEMSVAGFSEEDLKVAVEGKVLLIEGTKTKGNDEGERRYIHRKLASRDFKLNYRLSDKHDADKISVELDRGILNIIIPPKEEAKIERQQITINSSNKQQIT